MEIQMTGQPAELLARYWSALEEQAKADALVKYLEMEARLLTGRCRAVVEDPTESTEKQRKLNKVQEYIDQNYVDGEDDDWAQWLKENGESVTVAVAADHLGLKGSEHRVRALMSDGVLKHGVNSKRGSFRVDSISVVELVRFGEVHIRKCLSLSDQSEESGP